jgi:hypothetical protein
VGSVPLFPGIDQIELFWLIVASGRRCERADIQPAFPAGLCPQTTAGKTQKLLMAEREYLQLVSFLFAVALKPEKGRFIAIKSHRAITRKACEHAITELMV